MNPEHGQIRNETIFQSADGSLSIRSGKWKLELCPGSGGWSYPKPGEEPPGSPCFQLYDLDADVKEQRNLVNEHPSIVESLKKRLEEIIRNGRSTPGTSQPNDGQMAWDTISWYSG
jgi:arylsulfatase A-like enzyme